MGETKKQNRTAKEPGKADAEKDGKTGGMPNAGPHADPRLMNPDATPGSGVIAPIGETDEPNSQSTG
ncbi:MAG: hypothetical protein JWN07_121 [Hyphomicrobiales bacterium]|nr:hypothetical protein [Hyphomicrobiales bacterium]